MNKDKLIVFNDASLELEGEVDKETDTVLLTQK